MELFLGFYQTHHNLDAIPKPSIVTIDAEYPTIAESMLALQSHMLLPLKAENKGIQTYIKCLEMILTIPTNSYNKQVQENQ